MNTIDILQSIPSDRIMPNVQCPKVNSDRLNWNTEQCILRIEEDNPCVYGCDVSRKICRERGWPIREKGKHKLKGRMTSNGFTVKRPASRARMRRGSFGKISGDSWKGLLEHERRWGHESLWDRNSHLLVSVLRGATVSSVAKAIELTTARVNQILKAMCFTLNPALYAKLFDFVDGATRFKIRLARENRDGFLKNLPKEYPKYEGEEDA